MTKINAVIAVLMISVFGLFSNPEIQSAKGSKGAASSSHSRTESDYVYIQSAQEYTFSNRGYWDIGGFNPSYKKGQSIKVWELDGGRDRLWKVRNVGGGYVEIIPAYATWARVDVQGGNSGNGTNIHVWDANNSAAQRFRLHHVGGGKYKIFTTSGRVVCLAGRNSNNGSNVHIWQDHNGAFVEWVFIDKNSRRMVHPLGN